ncbi:MAG: hypothetical protein H6713_15220 [Myxococcales bacterium]|nr:hypothetical protein [Myxococcales bacterium]MCB9751326.1 hypothetical protein [Myxococcales bacterium]
MRTHEGEGRYNGAALNSFLLGLGHSDALVKKVLNDAGVDTIDPGRWYEINWAIGIYFAIAEQIGRAAIIAVGKKMIETAPFPPIDRNIKSLLMSLDAAYRLNAEGPNIGGITTEFHDDTSATSVWTSMGPCPLNIGIIQGCCSKLGIHAIVEHAPGECMDKGGASCTYHISF